jgi:hypothetical protein
MLGTLTPLATLGLGGQKCCLSGHERASQSNVADAQQNPLRCKVLFSLSHPLLERVPFGWDWDWHHSLHVMRGPDPRIHRVRAMDCRVKPGNDDGEIQDERKWH